MSADEIATRTWQVGDRVQDRPGTSDIWRGPGEVLDAGPDVVTVRHDSGAVTSWNPDELEPVVESSEARLVGRIPGSDGMSAATRAPLEAGAKAIEKTIRLYPTNPRGEWMGGQPLGATMLQLSRAAVTAALDAVDLVELFAGCRPEDDSSDCVCGLGPVGAWGDLASAKQHQAAVIRAAILGRPA